MSTSVLYHAFQIEGVKYNSTSYEGHDIVFHADIADTHLCCPHCKSQDVRFKGRKERLFHLPPMGRKQCFLNLRLHRIFCKTCLQLHWCRLPFMKGKSRMSRAFIRMALDLLFFSTIKSVAEYLRVGWDCIKDLHKDKLKTQYRHISLKELEYISIDEFAIAKGHEYMTIFTDIKSGRVIHAVEGKDMNAVIPFLKRLNKKAVNLKGIAMDMSAAFYAAVKQELAHISVIFDRFHVMKMMNTALDDVRKEQQRTCGSALKGDRFLLLKNYASLNENGMERLNALLAVNEPLFVAHTMKEQLRLFWDQENREAGEAFLRKWCLDALMTGIKPLAKVAKSLWRRSEGLLNYFEHRISNGKAEGINNKIKTLKRQAYGFRDMEYFKLRLYHLHEQRYQLAG
jgi:transposase